MRNILTLLFVLLLSSCGTTYQLSTLNHDPIYDNNGNVVDVTVIDNEFELARKFRTDDTFRWNYAQFAMRQDMRWNYDFYWNNRMHRRGVGSPFNFHWNSQQYWWNWASNSPFNMGFNHWDPFGFNNNYGIGWSYSWNNRRWSSNQWGSPYGWNNYYGWGSGYGWNNGFYNRYRGTNAAYHSGRRGSVNNEIANNRRVRTNINNTRTNTKPRVYLNQNTSVNNTKPRVVREKPRVPVIRNNNTRPPVIRNNNTRPPVIRNNNSRPQRTSTPPQRSSSQPVINRSSSRTSSNNNRSSTSRRKN